jgi:hypothetical protein
VPGSADVAVEIADGSGQVRMEVKREALAQYGLSVADVREAIELAMGSQVAAELIDGVRRVGIEWEGMTEEGTAPDKGDRILQGGGPTVDALNDVAATFCPDALGVKPQPLVLRAFAEDYLPGRGRVYSTPMIVYVVDKAEHALLMNERIGRLRTELTEIKDREQDLFQKNLDMRLKPAEDLLSDGGRQTLADRTEQRFGQLVANLLDGAHLGPVSVHDVQADQPAQHHGYNDDPEIHPYGERDDQEQNVDQGAALSCGNRFPGGFDVNSA